MATEPATEEWHETQNNDTGSLKLSLGDPTCPAKGMYIQLDGELHPRRVSYVMGNHICTKGFGSFPVGPVKYRWVQNGNKSDTPSDLLQGRIEESQSQKQAVSNPATTLESRQSETEPPQYAELTVQPNPENKQTGTAGNKGDVIKHVSLVALWMALKSAWRTGKIISVDSHAFQVSTPLDHGRESAWQTLDGLPPTAKPTAAANRYIQWQSIFWTMKREYLCSTGLALYALPDERTHFIWAEKDPNTRANLIAQSKSLVKELGLEGHLVAPLSDARQLEDTAKGITALKGAPAILFDPFSWNQGNQEHENLWRSLSILAGEILEENAPGFLLAFNYRHAAGRMSWPDLMANGWLTYPIAVIDVAQYHLAVYATNGKCEGIPKFFAELIIEQLTPLGWQPFESKTVSPDGNAMRRALHRLPDRDDLFRDANGEYWEKAGRWFVNQNTGATVALADVEILDGAVLSQAPERTELGACTQNVVEPQSDFSGAAAGGGQFTWKGTTLRFPTRAEARQSPSPELAEYLVQKLEERAEDILRTGLPSIPPFGYTDAASAAGVNGAMAVFPHLGMLQRWCVRNQYFDLSALIVSSKSQVPGGGHYVAHTVDVSEWRQYLQMALRGFLDLPQEE